MNNVTEPHSCPHHCQAHHPSSPRHPSSSSDSSSIESESEEDQALKAALDVPPSYASLTKSSVVNLWLGLQPHYDPVTERVECPHHRKESVISISSAVSKYDSDYLPSYSEAVGGSSECRF